MKKSRLISIVLAVALCVGCLTGCMGNVSSISINEDGSGTALIKQGFTKEGLEALGEMSPEGVDSNELETFDYNGFTYYGQIEEIAFANLDELNSKLRTDILEMSDASSVKISQRADKSFDLEFVISPEDTKQAAGEDLLQFSDPEEKAAMDELMKSLVIVLEFNFPYPVTQTEGVKDGVNISGNKLSLDFIKLSESLKNISSVATVKFTAQSNGNTVSVPTTPVKEPEVKPEVGRIIFKDVPNNMWYFPAVDKLANSGLIQGLGDGIFNPEGTLTYAQFCQILAKAKNLPTGEKDGYWAYKAIESCIETGFVTSIGEIYASVYDTPIRREAAIAAMYRAKEDQLTVIVNNDVSIPDLRDFSPIYAEEVINAYKYGITKGVDDKGTFLPKKSLTRAEICQLFYNLNWDKPEN